MLKKRALTWMVVLGVVAAAIAWALREPPVEVEVATVTRAPLVVTLDQEGRTHIEDRYMVSAPVAGFARRVELLPGDRVEAGEALVELEPLAPSALDPRSLAQARAELASAEAAARSARADAEAASAAADRARQRQERLARAAVAGAVAQDELDAAAAELRAAEAAARAAAYRSELARAATDATRVRIAVAGGTRAERAFEVRAPVSACVLQVAHESEGVVQAGEPLLELGCRESLEIHADVLSADAVGLGPGQRAVVEQWGGPTPLQARVLRVEPRAFTRVSALGVEEQRVWVVLELIDPPAVWDALGDGYRVMVRFELWRGEDVLQVPAAAVFERDGRSQVFVFDDDGRLALREVEPGHRSPAAVEILGGLAAGEEVVAYPRRELVAGQRAVRAAAGG